MKPSLSVLLLCWNHERFIEQCINSLIAQTNQDFDVVLLDNASSDDSVAIAERLFARSEIAYKVIQNDAAKKIAVNVNCLLAHAKGDQVSLLSTDDWYAPSHVEAMIIAAQNNPDIGWFSSGGWIYDEPTGSLEAVEKAKFEGMDVATSLLAGHHPFFFAGHCYRRSELISVGGWDEEQVIEDADMFFRLSKTTKHWIVDEKLVYYRKHGGSASLDPEFMVRGLTKFFEKHHSEFPDGGRDSRSKSYRHYAARYADLGQGWNAVRTAWRAIYLRPLVPCNWRTLLYGIRVALSRHRA